MYQYTDFCVCPECSSELSQVGESLQCQSCKKMYEIRNGIPILLPHYEDETKQRYFENYEKISVDDLKSSLEVRRDIRHTVLIDFFGNLKGKRVLDIGSSDAQYLRSMNAAFKVAFDISLPYLNAITTSNELKCVCGDAEQLPFKRGFFDVIIISDILEHLLNPQELVRRVMMLSTRKTQIFVHIPWEENLEQYAHSPYEFTHLRNFNSYTFAQLWAYFEIKRAKSTYPYMLYPLLFQLENKIPYFIYNLLTARYFFSPGVIQKDMDWRAAKIKALPKGDRWLLWFFKPIFKMYELRLRKQKQA